MTRNPRNRINHNILKLCFIAISPSLAIPSYAQTPFSITLEPPGAQNQVSTLVVNGQAYGASGVIEQTFDLLSTGIFSSAQRYFGMWWSAGDANNTLQFYNGNGGVASGSGIVAQAGSSTTIFGGTNIYSGGTVLDALSVFIFGRSLKGQESEASRSPQDFEAKRALARTRKSARDLTCSVRRHLK